MLNESGEFIRAERERILRGECPDPFLVLGAHHFRQNGQTGTQVCVFRHGAAGVILRLGNGSGPGSAASCKMTRSEPEGFYEAFLPNVLPGFAYQFEIVWPDETRELAEDPYRFPPVLSEFDLYLLGEGTHRHLYDKLGAHRMEMDGVSGVHFAVWAPNASGVSVVGNFNGWDGRCHPMRSRGISGIWELFIPTQGSNMAEGELYKYQIHSRTGGPAQLKADPVGFRAELRPKSASVVTSLDRYHWSDGEWMTQRASRNILETPMSVYEVHLGSWQHNSEDGWLTYGELADRLVPYVQQMGFTHIEILPVMEHPFDGSWGYQITGYYAPTSRFGGPEDFMQLIDRFHQAGIGVILDWVPGHFPNDAHGLARFDGTSLYEHFDPRQGLHPDWDTLIFNYGRLEVRGFLLANATFWIEKYHADGLRVDGVASMLYLDYSRQPGEWIPNAYGGRENLDAISFLQELNTLVHRIPGVFTVAEESTAWPGVTRPVHLGGLGFTFKWNLGWMHDVLGYFAHEPVHRRYHSDLLTFLLLYSFKENFVLPLSHDEVVHGKGSLQRKMPGDEWQRFANLRLLYGFMYGQPGKKLLFMGAEFGQSSEWNHDRSLDWWLTEHPGHASLREFVRDLNTLYRTEPALSEIDFQHTGFEWIEFRDAAQSVVSFLRRSKNPADFVVFICNFTPVPRHGYRIGVPEAGWYRELLNSDAERYGGSNLGNAGGCQAEPAAAHGRPWSLALTLPPLSVLILKRG